MQQSSIILPNVTRDINPSDDVGGGLFLDIVTTLSTITLDDEYGNLRKVRGLALVDRQKVSIFVNQSRSQYQSINICKAQ